MIEYNCRQAPTIIQVYAEAVFWCAQLFGSACEHAETILYSNKHAVTLLRHHYLGHRTYFDAFAKVLRYIARTSGAFL